MNNTTFKIGDKVRIINCSMIESYELNKIGTVIEIVNRSYVVDMGRPRRSPDDGATCWWLNGNAIELANELYEQLVFSFMEDN